MWTKKSSIHVSEIALEERRPGRKISKIKKILQKRLPITQWLPKYTKEDIVADFIAGLTVGMTMIPQSVAYAGLAGLKPQYGLYTAFIGSFTYVLVGSVKEVSIGPTSLMALLTFSFVVGKPVECVILLTFLAGIVELLMGLFKLGFLVDFLSPCLTSGFTSASAIIIIVSQLKSFFGIPIKSHSTFNALVEIFKKISQTKAADTCLGIGCTLFLLGFKQFSTIKTDSIVKKKILWLLSISKNALVVLFASLISFFWFNSNGSTPFKLTGDVPSGLPDIGFPPFSVHTNSSNMTLIDMVQTLGTGIVVIPVVAVLANVAIAKAYSADTIIDASQEMISLGLCNILGSFVKAMPSCGAFTRSSVASSSDVRSPLQGIYSGAVIVFALSFLAPFFFYIPKATLASVLIVAASSLVDYEILPILWKCSKMDFFITVSTFLIAVVKSVEMSIVIGAVFNLFILLKAWSRPNINFETRQTESGLDYLYVKPELGLFYPAADYLIESIKKEYRKTSAKPIVLDCYGVLQIDYSASKTVESLILTYKEGAGIVLINVKPNVRKALSIFLDEINLELCQTDNNIHSSRFTINSIGNSDEEALINGTNSSRKYSQDIRKGSICD